MASKFKSVFFSITALMFVTAFTFSGVAHAKKVTKVDVCHKGQTINVSTSALPAHMDHGDVKGSCEEMLLPEVVDIKCQSDETTAGVFLLSHLSRTLDAPDPGSLTTCPEVRQFLSDSMCRMDQQFGDPDGQVYTYRCPSVATEVAPE